jgi:hypothetical protein
MTLDLPMAAAVVVGNGGGGGCCEWRRRWLREWRQRGWQREGGAAAGEWLDSSKKMKSTATGKGEERRREGWQAENPLLPW